MLCLSLSALLYSPVHRLHKMSLHLFRYLALFLRSLSSIPSASCSGTVCDSPYTCTFGVRVGYCMSSYMLLKGRLFNAISMSNITSVNSLHVRTARSVTLYSASFLTKPTILSNCPPHHGARQRLVELPFNLTPCHHILHCFISHYFLQPFGSRNKCPPII